ncbi:MAG: hypothetical protein M3R02_01345 [Chloroflexota bacterium]|nr:hypothetical protein [Chloroflexota bacterium]
MAHPSAEYPPDFFAVPRGRRAPRWLLIFLPITLPLLLLRLGVRYLARILLAFGRVGLDVGLFLRLFAWTVGIGFTLRLVLFDSFGYASEAAVMAWFWAEARNDEGGPLLLDAFWAERLTGYAVARGGLTAFIPPLLLLALVWAAGLYLFRVVLRALRRGLSPDRDTPLPLPRPRLVAPTPWGLLGNALLLFLWGWVPALGLLLLPPTVDLFGRWHRTLESTTLAWTGLRYLSYPRLLDPLMADLQRHLPLKGTGMSQSLADLRWWSEGVPLAVHWNRYALGILAVELATVAAGLAVLMGLVWVWQSWAAAAKGTRRA